MANPADHLGKYQWKPGQSGNPAGPGPGPKLKTRLRKIIAELGLEDEILKVLIGAAIDEVRLLRTTEDLRVLDSDGNPVLDADGMPKIKKRRYKRNPSSQFMSILLERLEGRSAITITKDSDDIEAVKDFLADDKA